MGIGMAIGTTCLCRFAVETDKISMTAFRRSKAVQNAGIRERNRRNNEEYDGLKNASFAIINSNLKILP